VHHVRLEAIDCLAAITMGGNGSVHRRGTPAGSIAAGTRITARAPQTERALCNTVIHVGLIKADGDACTRKPYRPEDVI